MNSAFREFASATSTESADHIMPMHWYVACRLVIEGGFHPDHITPRPPLSVTERKSGLAILDHVPNEGGVGEATILGGLKTKNVDVVVSLPSIGPVLAVSMKGSTRAFRNLTNRMEEAAGDCTNLHMTYPAMVYGFWNLLSGRSEGVAADVSVTSDGTLDAKVWKYVFALSRLSGREDLREHPASYEACGFTLVDAHPDRLGHVHNAFPGTEPRFARLAHNTMFETLYLRYDERFVYQAPQLERMTLRRTWNRDSPLFACFGEDAAEVWGYSPRVG
jgi:hypothetical protein